MKGNITDGKEGKLVLEFFTHASACWMTNNCKENADTPSLLEEQRLNDIRVPGHHFENLLVK